MSYTDRPYIRDVSHKRRTREEKLKDFVTRVARMSTQDEIEVDHLADDSIETLNVLIREARKLAQE